MPAGGIWAAASSGPARAALGAGAAKSAAAPCSESHVPAEDAADPAGRRPAGGVGGGDAGGLGGTAAVGQGYPGGVDGAKHEHPL